MAAELQEGEPRQASLKAGGLGEGESSSSRVAQLSHLAIPTRDLLSWEESKKPLWGRLWRPGQNGAVRASVRGGGSCSRERQSPWNLVEGLGGTQKNPSPGLDASWEQRWVAGVGSFPLALRSDWGSSWL